MSTPSFGGRRVLAFESRRAKEIETLIATFDGRPLVAPAMREVPNDSDAAALELAHALAGGRFDAVIFLTGVGVRSLVAAVDRAGLRESFLRALSRTHVVARGPKPVAVLRELQVPVWVNAPEPNTWRELIAALDAKAREASWPISGKRIAVQEYGVSNVELLDALRARGADVTAVQAYQWALPEDVQPLRDAADAVARGDVDVVIVTSGVQFVHFWRVVEQMGLETRVREGLGHAIIASIGPSASAELRRHHVEPAFEPSHPKMGLLVREAAEQVSSR
ncbi:MAG TPA: uroporphyrinogen-III synthase [Vicinamibacterales bacterium]|jgi:uroporphyrinogen-III synthase|nr:uroporphyrinogen-III synthase [Vicinamibacterales bacterium]